VARGRNGTHLTAKGADVLASCTMDAGNRKTFSEQELNVREHALVTLTLTKVIGVEIEKPTRSVITGKVKVSYAVLSGTVDVEEITIASLL
jgi:hypothetical protein